MHYSELPKKMKTELICCDEAFLPKHASFFHYTRYTNAVKILDQNCEHNYFFVSNIGGMNDLHEKIFHNEDQDKVFVLSFCNTLTENLPLWFMYGGIDGTGVRIGFRPVCMKEFLMNIDTVYPIDSSGKPDRKHKLKKNVDFELECGWVLYYDYEKRAEYRGEQLEFDNSTEQNELKLNDNYFVKRYPWKYENEFRVVFKFKEKPSEKIALEVDFDKYAKSNGLRIGLAPGYNKPLEYGTLKLNSVECKQKRIELGKKIGLRFGIIENSNLLVDYNLLSINSEIILERIDDVLDSFEHFCVDKASELKKRIDEYIGKKGENHAPFPF